MYYLLDWRTLRDLTQAQLEKISGVDQVTLSDMEINPEKRRQPKTVSRLAKALGIRPDDLQRKPSEEEWAAVDKPKDLVSTVPTAAITEDELIDQILAIRYRGDLSGEGVRKLTNELIKTLIDERGQGGGSSTAPDTESP